MYYRVGLSFRKEAHERLIELSKDNDMGATPLIECLVYGLTPAEVKQVVKKGAKLRDESITKEKTLKKEARKVLAGMSERQLKALVGTGAKT